MSMYGMCPLCYIYLYFGSGIGRQPIYCDLWPALVSIIIYTFPSWSSEDGHRMHSMAYNMVRKLCLAHINSLLHYSCFFYTWLSGICVWWHIFFLSSLGRCPQAKIKSWSNRSRLLILIPTVKVVLVVLTIGRDHITWICWLDKIDIELTNYTETLVGQSALQCSITCFALA